MKARRAGFTLVLVACVSAAAETRQKGAASQTESLPNQPAAAGREAIVVKPSDERIRWVGHVDSRAPDARTFAWPATEVAIAFESAWLEVELTDTPRPDEQRESDWLSVELDAGPPRKLALREGRHLYELAKDLAPGRHTLRIRKRTEPEVGSISLRGFRLSARGRMLPPEAPPAHRIEVIGDSISTGYGNEGPDELCHFSAETQDATRTYATFAGRELDADVSVVAWSGKGVTRNVDVNDPETMAHVFERVLPSDPGSPPASGPVPHAFVINLGTNDFFHGSPRKTDFVDRYSDIVERLFKRAPEAKLVLVVPPLVSDQYPQQNARSDLRAYLEDVVAQQRGKGRSVQLLEQRLRPDEGRGCDHHPGLASQERLGHELAALLRSLLH